MTTYVTYPLDNGYVANWLVAGPQAIAIDTEVRPEWGADPDIEGPPVERGPLGTGTFTAGSFSGVWAYHACPADHHVDHSGSYARPHHLRSWACAEIVSDSSQSVTLELTTCGPAGMWLRDAAVFQTPDAGTHACEVQLPAGATPLLVRFEQTALGHTPHAMALRIRAEAVQVRIPTLISNAGRRNAFERLSGGVYFDRDVYEGDTSIVLRWPEGQRAFCPAHVRLHGADDSIYALADTAGEPGDALNLGFAMQLPAGPLRATLIPSPDEVYLENVRIEHHVPVWSMGQHRYWAVAASADLETRRGEALVAVAHHADSVFGQIARMALGAWDDVDTAVVLRATEAVRVIERGSNVALVGLLGMLDRFGDAELFRAEVGHALEGAVLGYLYEPSEASESERILVHAGEVLAGQRYPDRAFADGRPGAWHRLRGGRLALDWMSTFGSFGSADAGSADAIAHELVALSHLADLAEDTPVYELAAVCMDKLLFELALHSRHGVLGVACRGGQPSFIKSGYLQPTAGISRLLWGMGIHNHHVAAELSLACAAGYDPPPILQSIAHDAPAELWSRERRAPPDGEPTNINTYRTPDYMLSSLTSLAPASAGACELMWRVTLGAEAVVFVNHPGSSSESDSRVPGYWAGNGRVPRIAHWKDALVAMHRLDDDDVLGFTHAYFPCATFDEYVLRDPWAFARVGEGYLALMNSQGLSMTAEGRYARRELRACGQAQTWLVQMGRSALDGAFPEFQDKVAALQASITADAVRWTTLRGDDMSLTWNGPTTVNGQPEPARTSMHFDNPYATVELPCTAIEIRHGPDYLRLDFAASC